MKRIIILFVLLLMSCEKNPNNIEIKKEEFIFQTPLQSTLFDIKSEL